MKPCFSCGHVKQAVQNGRIGNGPRLYFIVCQKCASFIPGVPTPRGAINSWGRAWNLHGNRKRAT